MNRKIGFGIIGFGIFGEKRLIPGFSKAKSAKLIAITKRNIEEARAKARKYKIPEQNAYSSIDDLLADEKVEAVYIATPNKYHLEHTIKAAEAGKHILLEKPMAMNADECKKIIEECKKNGVKLMIAHCMRYNTGVNIIKEKIQSGELGKIVAINMHFYYDGSQSKRTWLFSKEIAGGGPIFDLGVHLIDLIRYLSGKEIVDAKTEAVGSHRGDVELKAMVSLKLEGDIIGSIGVGFEGNYYTSLEIIGTKLTIQIPYFNQIEREVPLITYADMKWTIDTIYNENCYSKEIDDFSECIINDSPVPIPGEEGLKNQEILDKLISY